MPLRNPMQPEKRLSSENASDTGYETLDSVADDQSQVQRSSASHYADGPVDGVVDDESPDEWLESMGVAADEIRRIKSKQVSKG